MQWSPCNHGDNSNLHEEYLINVRCVKVLLQKHDAHKVDNTCGNLDKQHLEGEVVDLSVDVQELYHYQRRESDSHYVCIGVIEEKNAQHYND